MLLASYLYHYTHSAPVRMSHYSPGRRRRWYACRDRDQCPRAPSSSLQSCTAPSFHNNRPWDSYSQTSINRAIIIPLYPLRQRYVALLGFLMLNEISHWVDCGFRLWACCIGAPAVSMGFLHLLQLLGCFRKSITLRRCIIWMAMCLYRTINFQKIHNFILDRHTLAVCEFKNWCVLSKPTGHTICFLGWIQKFNAWDLRVCWWAQNNTLDGDY